MATIRPSLRLRFASRVVIASFAYIFTQLQGFFHEQDGSHGEHSGSTPQILLCPEKFFLKENLSPLKTYFDPSNLKTWLRTCIRAHVCYYRYFVVHIFKPFFV